MVSMSLVAMQEVRESADTELGPLLLIDTAGQDMEELAEGSGSRSNAGEAGLALTHVRRLVAAGLKPQDIGVISPYSAQVSSATEALIEEPQACGAVCRVV